MKRSIPLDYKALGIALFVAVILTFQQLAIIILEYLFLKYNAPPIYAKVIAYFLSIFVILYYLNKAIKRYNSKTKIRSKD